MNDSRLLDALIFLLTTLILIKDREALESYLGNSPPQSLNTSHPPSLNTLSISIWGGRLHSSSQPNKANMNYLSTFSQAPPCHSTDANGEADPFERAFVWTITSSAVQRTRPKICKILKGLDWISLVLWCTGIVRYCALVHIAIAIFVAQEVLLYQHSLPLFFCLPLGAAGQWWKKGGMFTFLSPCCTREAASPAAAWSRMGGRERSFLQLGTSDSHSAKATRKAWQSERYRVKMTRFPRMTKRKALSYVSELCIISLSHQTSQEGATAIED